MAHWSDTCPHVILASVILKDNKIKLWKVGENPLKDKYNIEALVKEHTRYSYQEKEWTVFNDLGHKKVFNEHSRNWLKQWELHEEFKGCSPFEEDGFEDLIGDRYEVVKDLKIGN